MTPIERMQALEALMKTLFDILQWQGNAASIELINDALMRLTELQEQENLLAKIF